MGLESHPSHPKTEHSITPKIPLCFLQSMPLCTPTPSHHWCVFFPYSLPFPRCHINGIIQDAALPSGLFWSFSLDKTHQYSPMLLCHPTSTRCSLLVSWTPPLSSLAQWPLEAPPSWNPKYCDSQSSSPSSLLSIYAPSPHDLGFDFLISADFFQIPIFPKFKT